MFGFRAGAAAAFAFAALASASMSASAAVDLGNLSDISPSSVSYTRSFGMLDPLAFVDDYTFSLGVASNVSGATAEKDAYASIKIGFLNFGVVMVRNLELGSISLAKQVSPNVYTAVSADSLVDDAYSFSNLLAGSYKLTVTGSLAAGNLSSGSAANVGKASYTLSASAAPIASPTPEASDFAMAALGLAGVAFWSRRQKKA
jgi:MYXO-CTERM domain-containing protein